jgi:hypothetical protein
MAFSGGERLGRVAVAVLATSAWLHAGAAQAIVGGADHSGPLALSSVMVLSSRGSVCSAVVVAGEAVLTAAHCVRGGLEHRVHFPSPPARPR